MSRLLLNLATGTSIVFCVLAGTAWERSHRSVERLEWAFPAGHDGATGYDRYRGGSFAYHVGNATISLGERNFSPGPPPPTWWTDSIRVGVIGCGGPYEGALEPGVIVRFPLWMVCAAGGVLPLARAAIFAAGAVRRRRRRSLGLCQSCGYDLRATGEQCPECGGRPGARSSERSRTLSALGLFVPFVVLGAPAAWLWCGTAAADDVEPARRRSGPGFEPPFGLRPVGRVVRVPDPRLMIIDCGSAEGMASGVRLEVFDRQSGVLTARKRSADDMPEGTATIEVIRVMPGYAECAVVRREPSVGVNIGDLVVKRPTAARRRE